MVQEFEQKHEMPSPSTGVSSTERLKIKDSGQEQTGPEQGRWHLPAPKTQHLLLYPQLQQYVMGSDESNPTRSDPLLPLQVSPHTPYPHLLQLCIIHCQHPTTKLQKGEITIECKQMST